MRAKKITEAHCIYHVSYLATSRTKKWHTPNKIWWNDEKAINYAKELVRNHFVYKVVVSHSYPSVDGTMTEGGNIYGESINGVFLLT